MVIITRFPDPRSYLQDPNKKSSDSRLIFTITFLVSCVTSVIMQNGTKIAVISEDISDYSFLDSNYAFFPFFFCNYI
jgi:hypothetical protein